MHAGACRAEAEVDSNFDCNDQDCTGCGEKLPAVFFLKGMKQCRTCISDYNRQRSAACLQYAPVAMRHCGRCHELLTASEFSLLPPQPTGLHSQCNRCRSREYGRKPGNTERAMRQRPCQLQHIHPPSPAPAAGGISHAQHSPRTKANRMACVEIVEAA